MDENTTPDPITSESSAPTLARPVSSPQTPSPKKAKRKEMFKRLGLVSGAAYLVVIIAIFAWAALAYGKTISVFDYLPISQVVFSNFLFALFNVMFGLILLGALGFVIVAMIKNLMTKKEEEDKKKKWKKFTIFGGIGAFLLAILWIAAIWFLGPRLVSEVKSGIVTDPANTLGLTAPVEIVFDASYIPLDTEVYEIIAYTWNFGDGEIANGKTVSHRYTSKGSSDGRYTVTLNVDYQNSAGDQNDAEFTTEVSIDNELVTADFDATPDSGEIPLTVKFNASASYDPDGEIIAYEWDLDGDGRYDDAEGEEVQYIFEREGSFEVSLRVTDNNGEYNTTSMTIEAGSVNGLRAVITTDADEDTYYLDEKYEFDGNDSTVREGKIVSYVWDFGDGTTTQSRTANHTYTAVGSYEVVLTIEDSEGNEDQSTLEIIVVDEGAAPSADFVTTPTSIGAVPLTVKFDAASSSDPDKDIVQYEWDLNGDGKVDETGDAVSYTYTEVGTYEVTLTVTDSIGNIDEVTKEVEAVSQGISADLDVNTTNGEVPLTVSFDASGSSYKEGNIVSYEYDFGDGSDTYVGGSSVKYKYTSVGTFTASVTVVGDDGASDFKSVQIVVRPVGLTACFTVNTDSGSAPLFVSVDPSCSEGTISSYSWDFDDGELSFDRKPETHVYSKSGTYTITLEITSGEGIVDTFENTITVK